ncbi:hypothetical protein SLA2020_472170 [Shorea laevis]
MLGVNVLGFVLFSTLMLLLQHICDADNNVSASWECSEADNSTSENSFQANLNSLLNQLAGNGPARSSFYKTTAGKKSDKIYGLVQCRGDVSAENCANCTKQSISAALQDCPKSKNVKVWFTWCFLRYSDQPFFGVWDQSSTAVFNDTNFDDPSVGSQGFNFINGVAAAAANQPLMFEAGVLDVGRSGRRYGMAQCTRDISGADCRKCLDTQLMTFRTTVGNKRGWEIYGSSCSMWYHDYQFYFNMSTSSNHGTRRSSSQGIAIEITMIVLVFVLVVWPLDAVQL